MNTSTRSATRTLFVAVRAMILATVALGIIYPLIITGIGQLTMPGRADGSMVRTADGRTAGSRLIGQSFINAKGTRCPATSSRARRRPAPDMTGPRRRVPTSAPTTRI